MTSSSRPGRRTSQERANAGQQLAGAEGLRHVVVGAELEADDLVDLAGARREHKDRHAGLATQDAADLEAVDHRQHEVQQHEVGAFLARDGQSLVAIGSRYDAVALALEVVPQGGDQRRLIINKQDGFSRGRSSHVKSLTHAIA